MKNTVLCYLEETVKKYPDKTAIVDEWQKVTFSQLRNRAIQIAGQIKEQYGLIKQSVFVYLPKSANSIISFMGVLYSGNYYTPTDVSFPFNKVEKILDQLQPSVFISDTNHVDTLIENGIAKDRIINMDLLADGKFGIENTYYDHIIDSDLAYVFFTSGSTGIPKGVAIRQCSIIDYADWVVDTFGIDSNTKFGNQAPLYFDNSILDIYSTISTGATMYIVPESYFTYPKKVLNYIIENDINTIFWVPSALISVANYKLLDIYDCSCLNKVLFCGEVMPNKQLNYWRSKLPNVLYANLYGPTEITDVCTYYIVDREFKDDDPLPIGKGCRNTEILIIDDNNEIITEAGKMGELCVRGNCVSVGYYNNTEKTRAAFTQNPLNPFYDEKIYHTGDLVFYNEYGELEFAGRKDYQIKHMGYRIELGEIETAVFGNDSIKNACAVYDDNNKEIVLFYQGDISDRDIIMYLKTILPKYMIPTKYYQKDSFPYNDNGKIDRIKLKKSIMTVN